MMLKAQVTHEDSSNGSLGYVRSGKAPVRVVRKNDAGPSFGGGALDWPLLASMMMSTLRRAVRSKGIAT